MINRLIGVANFFAALVYLAVTLGNIFMVYGGPLLYQLLKIILPVFILVLNILVGSKVFNLTTTNKRILGTAISLILISIILFTGYIYFLNNLLVD